MNDDRFGDELKYPPHPDPDFWIAVRNAVFGGLWIVLIVVLLVNWISS